MPRGTARLSRTAGRSGSNSGRAAKRGARSRTIDHPRATPGQDGALPDAAKCASRRHPVRGVRRNVSTRRARHHECTQRLSPHSRRRQQAAWASGDYAVIGTTLQIVGEQLAEACDLNWDERVLDVAAGNGNATLAAARRGCSVTSTDYVSALLDRGAERARAERLDVKFQVADAEALPFRRRELRRRAVHVRRDVRARSRDGRLRDGARLPSRRAHRPRQLDARRLHRPDVQGAGHATCRRLPACSRRRCGAWKRHLESLFGDARPRSSRRRACFNFRYRSAAHFIDVFRTWYGPVHKAFAALAGRQGRRAGAGSDRAAERLEPATAQIRWSCRANTSRSSSPAADAFERAWSRGCSGGPALRLGPGGGRLRAAVAGAAGARARCGDGGRGAGAGRARAGRRLRHRPGRAAGGARGRARRAGRRRRPVRPHGRRGAPPCGRAQRGKRDLRAHGRGAPGASRRQLRRRAVRARPHVRAAIPSTPHARCAGCCGRAAAWYRGVGRARALRLVAGVPDRRGRSRERRVPAVLPSRASRQRSRGCAPMRGSTPSTSIASPRRWPMPTPTRPATPPSSAARWRWRGRVSTTTCGRGCASATSPRSSRGAAAAAIGYPGEFVVATASIAPSGRA